MTCTPARPATRLFETFLAAAREHAALLPWLAALLVAASPLRAAPATPPVTETATLDSLMARRLSDDTTIVTITAPAEHRLAAVIDTLPQAGKTAYMTEALATRRITPPSPVTHKMWLRSPTGTRVMVYVPSQLAQRISAQHKPGDAGAGTALQLWNSRHGPGLLLLSFTAAAR